MKPKTAEKSDSTEPKRQNESTREGVLEAAFTLFCEHGFSDREEIAIGLQKPVQAEDEEDEAEKDARNYDGFGSHG